MKKNILGSNNSIVKDSLLLLAFILWCIYILPIFIMIGKSLYLNLTGQMPYPYFSADMEKVEYQHTTYEGDVISYRIPRAYLRSKPLISNNGTTSTIRLSVLYPSMQAYSIGYKEKYDELRKQGVPFSRIRKETKNALYPHRVLVSLRSSGKGKFGTNMVQFMWRRADIESKRPFNEKLDEYVTTNGVGTIVGYYYVLKGRDPEQQHIRCSRKPKKNALQGNFCAIHTILDHYVYVESNIRQDIVSEGREVSDKIDELVKTFIYSIQISDSN